MDPKRTSKAKARVVGEVLSGSFDGACYAGNGSVQYAWWASVFPAQNGGRVVVFGDKRVHQAAL